MISIITPTYNRAYILEQLYTSLKDQTDGEFTWIIVDDGSIDNTKKMVDLWIKENKVNILYYYQSNKGKPSALNLGVKVCKTDYLMCVDSDEYLLNDAVQFLKELSRNLDDIYYGIVGYKLLNDVINCNFPEKESSTLSEIYKDGFLGETSLLLRRKYLENFPYPVFNNEKFIPEDYLYDILDEKYVLKIARRAFIVTKYLNDGLTINKERLVIDNKNSFREYYFNKYKHSHFLAIKLKAFLNYIIFSFKTRKNSINMVFIDYILYVLLIPIAIFLIFKRQLMKRE